MDVYTTLRDRAAEQGWNEESSMIHAVGFINEAIRGGKLAAEEFEAYLTAVAAEENAAVMQDGPRIHATFHPQSWQNDRAVDVDAEGPTTWDVTDHVTARGKEWALSVKDNHISSDDLAHIVPGAPDWITNWPGPFYVSVEDSIRDYFGEG